MAFLFGLTIGPVQLNIQESKKLKDLYGSSKIISDLMKNAINYILENDSNVEIIYPNYSDSELKDIDVTNYLICKISDKNILENIEKAVFRGKLVEFKDICFLFWASEEMDEREYKTIYNELTLKLKSAKNTYHFENMEKEASVNCTICGKPKEKKKELCGICQAKRDYGREKNYGSTYSKSIERWKMKYNKELESVTCLLEEIFKNTEKYYDINHIKNINRLLKVKHDEKDQIFKRTEIEEDLKDASESGGLIKSLQRIEKELENLYDDSNEKGIEKPHYNYCFMQVDVDNLGKWMSGKYIKRNSDLELNQKEISEYLTNFSKKLKMELGDYLIYSGGDDLLAIMPPEKVFETMKKVESVFNKEVSVKIDKADRNKEEITYSTSLTFVGCKNDMSMALNENRKTLEYVKKRYEEDAIVKNGVGINLIINSGKSLNAYMKKNDMKLFIENLALFDDTKKILKLENKKISFAYIDMFEMEFANMNYSDLSREDWQYLQKMMIVEFKRYLAKNYKFKNNEDDINTQVIKKYIEIHLELLKKLIRVNKFENSNVIRFDFHNLIRILRVYEKLNQYTFDTLKGGEIIETASN